MAASTDVLVVGAGAIGASVAAHLAALGARVVVLEKEQAPALHQSGRNSGVIHPGFNLPPGSLKAQFCVEGSRRLRVYCEERRIACHQGGILVVAHSRAECDTIVELQRRAQANGVASRLIPEQDIPEVEPAARGLEALHAPEGASFDSRTYVEALLADAVGQRARVAYGARLNSVRDASLQGSGAAPITVDTTVGRFHAAALVNCAGLHADRIARPVAADLRIIPFRGYYAELVPHRRDLVRSHIYRAPDLTFPFLGMHLSRRVDGRVIVGPGAMLAWGREAYHFTDFDWHDLVDTLSWLGFYRLLAQRSFRRLVMREVSRSLSLRAIWRELRNTVPSLAPSDLVRSYAGNRAQLVDKMGRFVDDIVVRETTHAVHVLNAVSPGLTCSLPFGENLAQRALAKLNG